MVLFVVALPCTTLLQKSSWYTNQIRNTQLVDTKTTRRCGRRYAACLVDAWPCFCRKRYAQTTRVWSAPRQRGRPGLALALRGTPVTNPILYLCDNQALLKAVKRWAGEGGKATLVGAPDADNLLEAIEELRKRTTAGAATSDISGQKCRQKCLLLLLFFFGAL